MIDVCDLSIADKNHFHFQVFHVDLDAAEQEFNAALDEVKRQVELKIISAEVGLPIANSLEGLNFREVDFEKFKKSRDHLFQTIKLLRKHELDGSLTAQLFNNGKDMIIPLLQMTSPREFASEEWFTAQYPIFIQLM